MNATDDDLVRVLDPIDASLERRREPCISDRTVDESLSLVTKGSCSVGEDRGDALGEKLSASCCMMGEEKKKIKHLFPAIDYALQNMH